MTNEVKLFLKKHDTCKEGMTWAIENCETMQDVWDTAKPEWLIWLATRKGVLPEKDLHRFSCWSVRQIWHLLKDERSRKAIEVKERWIEGEATDEELATAWEAADAAVGEATWVAARVAAREATWEATWTASWVAARIAAGAAAGEASWVAVRVAAWAAAREAQAKYIRDTFKPNFETT